MKKLLPLYRLERIWYSSFWEDDEGGIVLISGSRRWFLPRFDLLKWESVRQRIVFWIGVKRGKIKESIQGRL